MSTDTPETDAAHWAIIGNEEIMVTQEIDSMSEFARNLERQRNNTLALLEREQMRLVACDVIAMCDTPASAAEARQMHSDYESAALDSVKRRVDECIALRQMVRELRDALFGLTEECLLSGFNQGWDTYTEAQAALIKAKEVLK